MVRPRLSRLLSSLTLFLVAAMLLVSSPARAVESVRAGFFALEGYHDSDGKGNLSGYGYDFLTLVRRYADVRFEYVGHDRSWEEQRRMLPANEIDLLSPVFRTEENATLFDFSLPIGTATMRLSVREGDAARIPGDFATYRGLRVGVFRGGPVLERLRAFAARNGFSFTPVPLSSPDEVAEAFRAGRIDAVAATSLCRPHGEKVLSEFGSEFFYAVVRKGDAKLLRTIDAAIRQMDAVEGDWRSRLACRHGATERAGLRFTDEERAFIAAHSSPESRVLVAMNDAWPPFSSWKDGAYVGILPEYVNALMRRAGLQYAFFSAGEGSAGEDRRKDGEAVLFLGCGLDDRAAERQGLVLGPPLLHLGASMLTRKDVGAVSVIGLSGSDPCLNGRFVPEPRQRTVVYKDAAALRDAVESGAVDAGLLYTYEAMYLVNRDAAGHLSYTLHPSLSVAVRAALPEEDSHVLLGILAKCARVLPDSEEDALISANLAYGVSEMTPGDWLTLHGTRDMGFLCLVLLVAVLFVYMSRKNRRLKEEHRQKELLDEKNQELLHVQRALNAGIWRMGCSPDGAIKTVEIGSEIRKILGVRDDGELDSLSDWTGRIHPDDVDRVLKEHDLTGGDVDAGRTYQSTYRLRNGGNGYSIVRSASRVVCDADGRLKGLVGFLVDVTEEHSRDRVTGGLTREGFLKDVADVLAGVDDVSGHAVCFFNLRNFKAFNALWGFDAGDRLLRWYHERLRCSELAPAVLGRKEDHFFCLVRWREGTPDAVRAMCSFEYDVDGTSLSLCAVCGVYRIDSPDVSPADMLDRARLARKSIPDEFITPYAVFDEDMGRRYAEVALAAAELRAAIAERQLVVYYQPIVECQTGRVVSAEALIRWKHPERGMISPGVFIPAMEKDGLVSAVDRYVVEHVWDMYRRRLAAADAVVPVSVNLSWMDFYDRNLIEWILDAARQGDYPAELLRCEITESSYAALSGNADDVFGEFRDRRISLLLDDFGTGVSSLDLLQKYSFDILKIDMSFTRKIGLNARTMSMLRSIIDMCHQLGVKVVAEGVETQGQIDFYRHSGCDYIQGYYFHRPMPEDKFLALLDRQREEGVLVDYRKEKAKIRSSFYKSHVYFPNPGMFETCSIAIDSVLSLLGESSGVGSVCGLYDDRRTLCFFSLRCAGMLGYTVEELATVSKGSYLEMIAPGDRDAFLDDPSSVRYYSLLMKDGSFCPVRSIHRNVTDEDGTVYWVCTVKKVDADECQSCRLDLPHLDRPHLGGELPDRAF